MEPARDLILGPLHFERQVALMPVHGLFDDGELLAARGRDGEGGKEEEDGHGRGQRRCPDLAATATLCARGFLFFLLNLCCFLFERREDVVAQRLRGAIFLKGYLEVLLELELEVHLLFAGLAVGQVGLELDFVTLVKFSIDVGIDKRCEVVAVHFHDISRQERSRFKVKGFISLTIRGFMGMFSLGPAFH